MVTQDALKPWPPHGRATRVRGGVSVHDTTSRATNRGKIWVLLLLLLPGIIKTVRGVGCASPFPSTSTSTTTTTTTTTITTATTTTTMTTR